MARMVFAFAVMSPILVGGVAMAQPPQPTASQRPALMERQKEVALALSSCPASVASKAAVYVLEKAGYVKIRDGENGFTAIVQHSMPMSQEPQCMDPEGARTFLSRVMKVAELRAQGKGADEIQALLKDAAAKGVLPTPTHPGVIYMLSTQNRVPNARGQVVAYPPHVMFYGTQLTNAALGVDAADLAADGNPKGPTFVAGDGSPYALIIVPTAPHTTEHRE